MTLSIKQVVGLFIMASFMIVALFSFAIMIHGLDGKMPEGCPFSVMSKSICPQDVLTAAFHHISAYRTFLGAFINNNILILIVYLFLTAWVSLAFLTGPPLLKPLISRRGVCGFPLIVACNRQIIRWLSLFENSPSLP